MFSDRGASEAQRGLSACPSFQCCAEGEGVKGFRLVRKHQRVCQLLKCSLARWGSSALYARDQMPASGDGPRRTTSLEEVVISTSPASESIVDRVTRREGQHSSEPLLEGSSPQQHGHWFRHRARPSHTGSEYDPDEQAAPDVQQPAGDTADPLFCLPSLLSAATHCQRGDSVDTLQQSECKDIHRDAAVLLSVCCSALALKTLWAMQSQRRKACLPVQLRSCRDSKSSNTCGRGIRHSRTGYCFLPEHTAMTYFRPCFGYFCP